MGRFFIKRVKHYNFSKNIINNQQFDSKTIDIKQESVSNPTKKSQQKTIKEEITPEIVKEEVIQEVFENVIEEVVNNETMAEVIIVEEEKIEEVMDTKEKIELANAVLGSEPKVKKVKKEKGLIERTESSVTILTEDNRELLKD